MHRGPLEFAAARRRWAHWRPAELVASRGLVVAVRGRWPVSLTHGLACPDQANGRDASAAPKPIEPPTAARRARVPAQAQYAPTAPPTTPYGAGGRLHETARTRVINFTFGGTHRSRPRPPTPQSARWVKRRNPQTEHISSAVPPNVLQNSKIARR